MSETKKMVMENICFLLNQFIRCGAYENIIFCLVMHEQGIIDGILSGLEAGIRSEDVIQRSIARIGMYEESTWQIKYILYNTVVDNTTMEEKDVYDWFNYFRFLISKS